MSIAPKQRRFVLDAAAPNVTIIMKRNAAASGIALSNASHSEGASTRSHVAHVAHSLSAKLSRW